ncbi:hypothetical protein PENSPDRAFT_671896 [Peniophora sp. CONT]|nr:hypothetical protein PENSPDRAFT_671896 [Peniophora sp. CONT]
MASAAQPCEPLSRSLAPHNLSLATLQLRDVYARLGAQIEYMEMLAHLKGRSQSELDRTWRQRVDHDTSPLGDNQSTTYVATDLDLRMKRSREASRASGSSPSPSSARNAQPVCERHLRFSERTQRTPERLPTTLGDTVKLLRKKNDALVKAKQDLEDDRDVLKRTLTRKENEIVEAKQEISLKEAFIDRLSKELASWESMPEKTGDQEQEVQKERDQAKTECAIAEIKVEALNHQQGLTRAQAELLTARRTIANLEGQLNGVIDTSVRETQGLLATTAENGDSGRAESNSETVEGPSADLQEALSTSVASLPNIQNLREELRGCEEVAQEHEKAIAEAEKAEYRDSLRRLRDLEELKEQVRTAEEKSKEALCAERLRVEAEAKQKMEELQGMVDTKSKELIEVRGDLSTERNKHDSTKAKLLKQEGRVSVLIRDRERDLDSLREKLCAKYLAAERLQADTDASFKLEQLQVKANSAAADLDQTRNDLDVERAGHQKTKDEVSKLQDAAVRDESERRREIKEYKNSAEERTETLRKQLREANESLDKLRDEHRGRLDAALLKVERLQTKADSSAADLNRTRSELETERHDHEKTKITASVLRDATTCEGNGHRRALDDDRVSSGESIESDQGIVAMSREQLCQATESAERSSKALAESLQAVADAESELERLRASTRSPGSKRTPDGGDQESMHVGSLETTTGMAELKDQLDIATLARDEALRESTTRDAIIVRLEAKTLELEATVALLEGSTFIAEEDKEVPVSKTDGGSERTWVHQAVQISQGSSMMGIPRNDDAEYLG